MHVQPYLFFDGCCEEAVAFYQKTLGAGSWLLWLHRHRAMAVIGVVSVLIAYGAVFLHHLRFAGMLGDPHLACRLAPPLAAGDMRSLDNPTRS
jgi:hypothetical protein